MGPVLFLGHFAVDTFLRGLRPEVIAAAVAFAAVYLQHHWVLDVIGGALLALMTYNVVIRVEKWNP